MTLVRALRWNGNREFLKKTKLLKDGEMKVCLTNGIALNASRSLGWLAMKLSIATPLPLPQDLAARVLVRAEGAALVALGEGLVQARLGVELEVDEVDDHVLPVLSGHGVAIAGADRVVLDVGVDEVAAGEGTVEDHLEDLTRLLEETAFGAVLVAEPALFVSDEVGECGEMLEVRTCTQPF